ncbi:BTB/POZ domain-containing protein At5g48800-like isoform X2 [Salvia miltiorrhiza]|uniref:BTB/POZ domain-containing protein At5g48800-like isoform X2 n=1 Tax=Salvia miltiorrhiza TaxID=226208 RepID=UPI0025AC45F1|nr:BTB/POZ domain-containing protein At5g48800-like isoform X2 [Salvia miltiorrhiza]
MDKRLQPPPSPNCKRRQRRCEWVFRDVPSDLTIEVDAATFSLHKFPLISRCGRIRKLVALLRGDSEGCTIELGGLPGGAESFELAAQFCYGVNFEITAANAAHLYCAAHYLEMTEEYSKSNLAARAEEYLDSVVCKSLEMCVEVLRHCEDLLPLADDLRIVPRCIDAIASKACVEQIASSFSRLEYSSSGRLHMSRQSKGGGGGGDWWAEDLSVLRIDLYQRVIAAMKCRGVRPESIGAALASYAEKELLRKPSDHDHEPRLVVEAIVGLLPAERFAVPLSFLFGMLKSAVALGCAAPCRVDLERRIGSQLDGAALDDVLIPSCGNEGDTLFDVDTFHRILINFSQQDCDSEEEEDDDLDEGMSLFECDSPAAGASPSQSALFKVSKLVDSYLTEIASDANLKLSKFVAVAESLPAHARTLHDGLYRAIDVYLKAHQGLTDQERRKVCKLIDFQKVSQEAGSHAAQNERLPLQSVVQVLYYEQLRLRSALMCSFPDEDAVKPAHHQSWRMSSGAVSAAMSPRDNYASLRRENRELKLELARLRMRLNDLEKEHVCMKRNMNKSGSRKFMIYFSKTIGLITSKAPPTAQIAVVVEKSHPKVDLFPTTFLPPQAGLDPQQLTEFATSDSWPPAAVD